MPELELCIAAAVCPVGPLSSVPPVSLPPMGLCTSALTKCIVLASQQACQDSASSWVPAAVFLRGKKNTIKKTKSKIGIPNTYFTEKLFTEANKRIWF